MGYYIETGTAVGKAGILVKEHGASEITRPEAFTIATNPEYPRTQIIVVVLENGMFEAAGIAFDIDELKEFTDLNDSRPRTILSMDQEEAWKLAGGKPEFMAKKSLPPEKPCDRLMPEAKRREAIATATCALKPLGCGGPATEFRNEISRREYGISGLCQKCQDDVFGLD